MSPVFCDGIEAQTCISAGVFGGIYRKTMFDDLTEEELEQFVGEGNRRLKNVPRRFTPRSFFRDYRPKGPPAKVWRF